VPLNVRYWLNSFRISTRLASIPSEKIRTILSVDYTQWEQVVFHLVQDLHICSYYLFSLYMFPSRNATLHGSKITTFVNIFLVGKWKSFWMRKKKSLKVDLHYDDGRSIRDFFYNWKKFVIGMSVFIFRTLLYGLNILLWNKIQTSFQTPIICTLKFRRSSLRPFLHSDLSNGKG
jgi:hypothetical protein